MLIRAMLFTSFVTLALFAHGEEHIRDFYAEPGLNPKADAGFEDIESIDPFSGMLSLKLR